MKNNHSRVILLALIIICFSELKSQSYQPFPQESASWEVIRCWIFFQSGWYDHYTFSVDGSDTLYQGELYKKIYITEHQAHAPAFDSIFPPTFFGGMREENKQVFIFQSWASIDTTEHLVYDFNKTTIGDTIFTSSLAGPSSNMLGHLITDVDSVLIGSNYHRRLHLQDPNNEFNTEEWIEGVGSSWGMPFASFWSITDNSYDLSCFHKDHQFQYENPEPGYGFCFPPLPDLTCDTTSTIVSDLNATNSNIKIFPNPADQLLQLEINDPSIGNLSLYIFDTTGKMVAHELISSNLAQVNVEKYKSGIYILVFKSNKFLTIQKLMIQHY